MDGILLRKSLEKIKGIEDEKLEQIYQSGNRICFQTEGNFLHFSLNHLLPFISISPRMSFSPDEPKGFVMFLRNTVKNSRILSIEQMGYDRVIIIALEKMHYGVRRRYEMVVELMGKFSNMILVDVERRKILMAHRNLKTKYREILPGATFEHYPRRQMNPYLMRSEDLIGLRFAELYGKVEGFSRLLMDEIKRRCGISNDQIIDRDIAESLIHKIHALIEEAMNTPGVYLYEDEEKVYVSPLKLKHLERMRYEHHDEIHEGLETALSRIEHKMESTQLVKRILAEIGIRKRKMEKLLSTLKSEYENSREYERYRKFGEILKANLKTAVVESNSAICFDWEKGENVEIPIDPKKSVMENAQVYFERYRKLLRKMRILEERIEKVEDELEELENIEKYVNLTRDLEELRELEIKVLGKTKRDEVRKTDEMPGVLRFEKNGFTILVGKNAKQNEFLSFKVANLDDLWFHARNTAGSHVILRKAGKEPPRDVVEFAARIAATFSKASNSSKVEVDFTEVRNLRKPKNSRKGFVIYKNHKTLLVEPLEHLELSSRKGN